jgi:hypothetical protein
MMQQAKARALLAPDRSATLSLRDLMLYFLCLAPCGSAVQSSRSSFFWQESLEFSCMEL